MIVLFKKYVDHLFNQLDRQVAPQTDARGVERSHSETLTRPQYLENKCEHWWQIHTSAFCVNAKQQNSNDFFPVAFLSISFPCLTQIYYLYYLVVIVQYALFLRIFTLTMYCFYLFVLQLRSLCGCLPCVNPLSACDVLYCRVCCQVKTSLLYYVKCFD